MPPIDGSPLSRRAWLTTTSGVIAAGLLKTQADALRLDATEAPPYTGQTAPAVQPARSDDRPDPMTVPGRIVSEVGSRAPAEQPKRFLRAEELSSSSRSPLQDFHGIITPADLHFERHHAGVPDIRLEDHELLIHGMVERRLPDGGHHALSVGFPDPLHRVLRQRGRHLQP